MATVDIFHPRASVRAVTSWAHVLSKDRSGLPEMSAYSRVHASFLMRGQTCPRRERPCAIIRTGAGSGSSGALASRKGRDPRTRTPGPREPVLLRPALSLPSYLRPVRGPPRSLPPPVPSGAPEWPQPGRASGAYLCPDPTRLCAWTADPCVSDWAADTREDPVFLRRRPPAPASRRWLPVRCVCTLRARPAGTLLVSPVSRCGASPGGHGGPPPSVYTGSTEPRVGLPPARAGFLPVCTPACAELSDGAGATRPAQSPRGRS